MTRYYDESPSDALLNALHTPPAEQPDDVLPTGEAATADTSEATGIEPSFSETVRHESVEDADMIAPEGPAHIMTTMPEVVVEPKPVSLPFNTMKDEPDEPDDEPADIEVAKTGVSSSFPDEETPAPSTGDTPIDITGLVTLLLGIYEATDSPNLQALLLLLIVLMAIPRKK